MKNKFRVFLDLEETVIDNWDNGMLVNSTHIREFLSAMGVASFTVFSFAIENEISKAIFEKNHRPFIEQALDCKVALCPSIRDFQTNDTLVTGTFFNTMTDFILIRGKEGAFINWCRNKHPDENCVLVDDTVKNIDVIDRDTGQIIRFINVATLGG